MSRTCVFCILLNSRFRYSSQVRLINEDIFDTWLLNRFRSIKLFIVSTAVMSVIRFCDAFKYTSCNYLSGRMSDIQFALMSSSVRLPRFESDLMSYTFPNEIFSLVSQVICSIPFIRSNSERLKMCPQTVSAEHVQKKLCCQSELIPINQISP
ncbi:Hypothetical_protein [Hexamita inflata]|uniref:Hypothetical_protein n=1 Tax=Hexamita inflata TaxID=28002 RepID=A0AA86N9U8_9EUKA|nr:Hypothetical protein HINF_LOCUS3095 [Hexamita inflata]